MYAVSQNRETMPAAGIREQSYEIPFGGSYRECWTEDYSLSIAYENRRTVQAAWRNGTWQPVGGDAALCALLASSDCPPLTKQYFRAAASVAAAAELCLEQGLPLSEMGECVQLGDNPLTAPELMRLLMDEHGFSMNDAYLAVSGCCGDLRASGVDVAQVYPLQPRTAHVISILRSCSLSMPAATHCCIDPEDRSPLGAIPEGSQLKLSLRVLAGQAERAFLVLYGDELRQELPMQRQGDRFTVCLKAPEKAAALWYRFRLESDLSSHWLCPDNSGYRGRLYGYEAPGFRLTVYRRDFETPAWFRRSVMYQIFPDRFGFSDDGTAQAGIAYHQALGQTPELHASTREPVRYLPRPFEADYTPDDFYGGTLKGIQAKLPYLKELGVSCLYLNPIVEARSNHRYDTSDYRRVDPILGSNEDFEALCQAAEEQGMRIILDGVYSHTGADSLYFNRWGHYPGRGACQGSDSPYYGWYEFRHFPDDYRCWWGFRELPEVEETNPAWQDFVVTGQDSVVRSWLRRGAAGWRLDVADELPDSVLTLIRQAAKEEKPDALILGEVWEDAVIKESYGGRRNYALGYSLDTVMNYPLRRAVLDFVRGKSSAYELRDFLIGQQMNYPKPLYYSLMNLMGSHDVERLRSALATDVDIRALPRAEQMHLYFPPEALERALTLEKLCAAIQFSLPGVPSIYYGDEQGMCGVCDPFNRMPFREENWDLCGSYADLAARRNACPALATGEARFLACGSEMLLILRYIREEKDVFGLPAENGAYLTVVNRSGQAAEFTADCSKEGFGMVHGQIEACRAEILKLEPVS